MAEQKKEKKEIKKEVKKEKKPKKKQRSFFEKSKLRYQKVKDAMFEDLDKDTDKTTFSMWEVVSIILISIIFGVVIGYMVTYGKYSKHTGFNEVSKTYNEIVEQYYGVIDEDELAASAIHGMVDSLSDPYSGFINKQQTEDFNQTLDGSFIGIGVVITFNGDYNKVLEVYEGTPADKAGVQVGDEIILVDDASVQGVDAADISSYIRGDKGTKVRITVRRNGEEVELTMKRDVIELPSVTSSIYEEGDHTIGYLDVDTIAANTYSQFEKELKKLEKKHIDTLILDVRDNPGGHLTQTRDILSLFFPKKTVLFQVETNDKKKEKIVSQTKDTRDYRVIILTNGASASAAEVIVSCFKDNYKDVTVVGTPTYGKGTVQKSKNLNNGSSIKYTTQRWLTSKGKWIDGKGIVPDVEVKQSEKFYDTGSLEDDAQYQKALEIAKES